MHARRLIVSFSCCLLVTFGQHSVSYGQMCDPPPPHATNHAATDSPFTGLSENSAQQKYEQAFTQLRSQQRAAMRQAAQRWRSGLSHAKSPDTAVVEIANSLDNATDLALALEQMTALRGQLSRDRQFELDRVIDELAKLSTQQRNLKLKYQSYRGVKIAERWPQLSLNAKRAAMSDYYGLSDERPAWLLRPSPMPLVDQVPKAALAPVQRYESEKRDLLAVAYSRLVPQVVAIQAAANQAANRAAAAQQAAPSQRAALSQQVALSQQAAIHDAATVATDCAAALRQVSELLTAPYAQGMRGLMLIEEDAALPEELNVLIRQLRHSVMDQLPAIQLAHSKLVNDLRARLLPGQADRLARQRLDEQMIIDLHVAQTTRLWQPLRIFAVRTPRLADRYEQAQLCDVRAIPTENAWQYQVEFTIDGALQWVSADEVLLRPKPGKLPERMLRLIPSDGPGEPVTANTNLWDGDVSCHSAKGWMPVIVIDESPFGVIIRWHGVAEPTEVIEPREHLRIVSRS